VSNNLLDPGAQAPDQIKKLKKEQELKRPSLTRAQA